MNCPRCIKGQMLREQTLESDVPAIVCFACGYEEYQRKEWDREAVLADLHSEARSMSTAKRPVREWE